MPPGAIRRQQSAVDFDHQTQKPLWDESNCEVDVEAARAALEEEQQLELQAKAKAEAELEAKAKTKAELEAATTNAELEAATNAQVTSSARLTFETSRYRDLNDSLDQQRPINIEELWVSAEKVIAYYEGAVVASLCIEELRGFISNYCRKDYIDLDDVQNVSMLMWSSGKYGGAKSELCSLLNRALREDHACNVLEDAVCLSRALNKNLVASYVGKDVKMRRVVSGNAANYKQWPNGNKVVDKNEEGWSSNRDCTWRGGGMPKVDFEWYKDLFKKPLQERKFRTTMFVASSFSKNIAEEFAIRSYNRNDPDGSGKVLFRFEFERHRCLHVNYIDKSEYPQEKEFLLPPYTALELVEVRESKNLDAKPHTIVVKVAVDNQDYNNYPLNLDLANRI